MGCLHSREAQQQGAIKAGKVVAGMRISDLTYGIGSLMAWEPWSLAANGPDRVRTTTTSLEVFRMNGVQQILAFLSSSLF